MRKDFDIAIVGGGAAGLTAAIEAKVSNPKAKVIVLEKMEEPAKKLSATGNGRGNLSNRNCELLPTVIEFFSQCGIVTRADEAGRIYPYSEEAKAVSRALIKRATNLGAEIMTNSSVSNEEVDPEGYFHIFISEKNEIIADARSEFWNNQFKRQSEDIISEEDLLGYISSVNKNKHLTKQEKDELIQNAGNK